jgi:predicted MFS family arabinose efflux permease
MFGVGSVFGGYIGSKLCDKLKIKLTAVFGVFVYLMTCLFCIVVGEIQQLWSARLACFFWGFLTFYLGGSGMVICKTLIPLKNQS